MLGEWTMRLIGKRRLPNNAGKNHYGYNHRKRNQAGQLVSLALHKAEQIAAVGTEHSRTLLIMLVSKQHHHNFDCCHQEPDSFDLANSSLKTNRMVYACVCVLKPTILNRES